MSVVAGCKAEGMAAKLKGAEVLAIYRGGTLIKETTHETLKKDDTVLMAVEPKNLENLNKIFSNDEATSA